MSFKVTAKCGRGNTVNQNSDTQSGTLTALQSHGMGKLRWQGQAGWDTYKFTGQARSPDEI